MEKRRQVEERCRCARVELDAHERTTHFTELGHLLERGMAALPAALHGRWQQAAARQAWCRDLLQGASLALRPGAWRLQVATGLTRDELVALRQAAAELAQGEVTLEEDASLEAGLVVQHDGARYDGSLRGLLADRHAVQAALLAEIADSGSAT